jgi:3-methylcrotonyl-CoA carboxylase alpha subunit
LPGVRACRRLGLAKLIVTGRDRSAAISAARSAHARFQVVGVATPIPFRERLTSRPEFAGDEIDTRWVEQQIVQ